jgi:hypothetical protein
MCNKLNNSLLKAPMLSVLNLVVINKKIRIVAMFVTVYLETNFQRNVK